jgi:hypothetical protein
MTDIYDADDRLLLDALRAEKDRLQNGSPQEKQDAPKKIAILGDALYRLYGGAPPKDVRDQLDGVYDPEHDLAPIEDLPGETRLGAL